MGTMPRPLDLLDHEPPARRPLERETHLVDTVEARQPLPHRLARGRTDPAATHLTASDVDDRVRDLPTMNIKRAYDPHRDLLELHGLERPACSNTLVPRGSHHISSLWSPVVLADVAGDIDGWVAAHEPAKRDLVNDAYVRW
jgi:hypothetical protein